ncbi:MAG: MBL fold metallo-hydrolase [Planctomycetota bacterium]|nr:MAG: MBL fold metallo-hydrolase [Planctomycetota bacterium]
MKTLDLGELRVHLLRDGTIGLDGGAMFGITPKKDWAKCCPPDEKNRITLALNSLLVESPEGNILIEAGVGVGYEEKFCRIYRVEREETLLEALERRGVGEEDIDILILTHLHFDHKGWLSCPAGGGEFRLTFPKAKVYVQKRHWQEAISPHPTVAPSFLQERIRPLAESSLLCLVEGAHRIHDFLEVELAEGHTEGQQVVLIRSQGKVICFTADLIPTAHHVNKFHIMAYDRYPEITFQNKVQLLERAVEEGWLLVFPHELERNFVVPRVVEGKGGRNFSVF